MGAQALDALEPPERAVVLDRLLDAHPDLFDEASAVASELLEDVDAQDVRERVVETFTAQHFTVIADRVGRQPGRGYVHETDAQVEVLEQTLRPFLHDLVRRATAGHVRAATDIAVGVLGGLHDLATGASAETLIGWGEADQNARDLADALRQTLTSAGIELPHSRVADAAPRWADHAGWSTSPGPRGR